MKLRMILAAAALLVPAAVMAQGKKPSVAVVKMDDLARSGQADTLSAMIETAIAGTGKFRLIERQQMGKLVGEQTRAKGGVVTTNTPGRIGGFEGTDYLIYGTITSVSARNANNVGGTMLAGFLGNKGTTCSNKVATLALDIKITDADSGEIKYVTRIDETQKSATACGSQANIDTALLMRSAADKVASGLVTAIYPIQVAAVQGDGSLVLNYGEGAVQPGAVMAVYAKGEPIRDPSSGELIGSTETKLGLVRVSEVTGRLSKAVLATKFASVPAVGSVVRPASTDEIRTLVKPGKQK